MHAGGARPRESGQDPDVDGILEFGADGSDILVAQDAAHSDRATLDWQQRKVLGKDARSVGVVGHVKYPGHRSWPHLETASQADRPQARVECIPRDWQAGSEQLQDGDH